MELQDKMTEYLIRTDKEEKKTYVFRIETTPKNIGLVYTDFNLNPGIRDITLDDVVNPDNNQPLAKIRLYQNGNVLSVNSKKKELSALSLQGDYKEEGIIIPHRKLTKSILLSKQEYKALEEMGVASAYFIGDKSPIAQVFCFEKEGDISGVVYTRNPADNEPSTALKGLTLVLAERIENQDYLFEFLRE